MNVYHTFVCFYNRIPSVAPLISGESASPTTTMPRSTPSADDIHKQENWQTENARTGDEMGHGHLIVRATKPRRRPALRRRPVDPEKDRLEAIM